MNTRILDDIAQRLVGLLPPQLGSLRDDMRANFRALLQNRLAELDLVPREEFDAAQDMLAQARAQVDELEHRVAELEARDDATDLNA